MKKIKQYVVIETGPRQARVGWVADLDWGSEMACLVQVTSLFELCIIKGIRGISGNREQSVQADEGPADRSGHWRDRQYSSLETKVATQIREESREVAHTSFIWQAVQILFQE